MNLLFPVWIEAVLAVLALGTLVGCAIRPPKHSRVLGVGLALVVATLFVLSFTITPQPESYFGGAYRLDSFALFFKRLTLLITALVLVCTAEYSPRLGHAVDEHYVLMLLASVGMLVMASTADFILLFVAIELVTVSFFTLTSHRRDDPASLEAGMKYLVMGAVSSGLLVYGISYVFGTTGATDFATVSEVIRQQSVPSVPLALGILMILLGLGFKLATVPGHMWAPDVYQGAPLSATAFLATGSKAAGFAVLIRLLFECVQPARAVWDNTTMFVAGATVLYGSLGSLRQRDLKRLLGYSSIAQAGYLLLGVEARNALGLSAMLFYLVQYVLTAMAAFLVLASVARAGGGSTLGDLAGLHRRSPLLAIALALSMLSLAGVPPLSGFFGKFLLFTAVLQNGLQNPALVTLAIVAAAGVVISMYAYFNVVRAIYVDNWTNTAPIPVGTAARVSLLICIAGILILGFYQEPVLSAAGRAIEPFLAALTR